MGLMKRDVKISDAVFSSNISSAQGASVMFCPLPGNLDGQRVGRKTNVIKIDAIFRIKDVINKGSYATAAESSNAIRLVLFVDFQPNAALAASTALLDATADALSFYETDNSDRFRILSDRMWLLGASKATNAAAATDLVFTESNGRGSYAVRQSLSLRDGPVETVYNAVGGATEASVTSGLILLLPISSSAGVAALNGTWRFYYTDC